MPMLRPRVWLLLLCCGCESVSLPKEHFIDSLRVLGVRADPATLAPGKTATLSVICADGARGGQQDPTCDVEVAWFADCNNPDRNDPKKCFGRYQSHSEALASPLSDTAADAPFEGFHFGPEFEFVAPADILVQEASFASNVVRFGTSYVYFAVCAGQLYPVDSADDRLPVECHDRDSGTVLDQRRFVVGYTTVYSYDLVTSRNPALLTPRFDGVSLPTSCTVDADCPAAFSCSTEGQCAPIVETCSANNRRGCQWHCLDFELGLESFAPFGVDGAMLSAPQKSLWLDFFTNAGSLPDDASFALQAPSDPATPRRTRCANWQAPAVPTEQAHLWVVVRDNRGGLSAWNQRIIVR
jgi:hypothetical protein